MVLNDKATLSSAELIALDNEQIAMRLLLILTQDTDRQLGDVLAIAKELHYLAVNSVKGGEVK